MATIREWVIRLWWTLRPKRADAELEAELRLHLELAAEDERRRANGSDDAGRAAAIRSGGMAQAMEAVRDQRGLPWLNDLPRDLRYGLRALRRNPLFASVAVLTLALGIGANAFIFSVINVVLLKRFPYADANRLVLVEARDQNGQPGAGSPGNFVDWRQQAKSFEYLAAKIDWSGYDVTGPEGPDQIVGVPITAGLFEVLGVQPQRGRMLVPADDRPDAPRVAVVSDRLWQRRFKGDPQVIGKTITLNSIPHTIIGIMPPGFHLNREVTNPADVDQLWVSFAAQVGVEGMSRRESQNLRVWGRLRPGVTLEQAQAELTVIDRRVHAGFPGANAGRGVVVTPLSEFRADRVNDQREVLMLLLGAVGFVLLIACANVANLQLARAASQVRDMAVRTALGASRFRLIRQALSESILLALMGGLVGLIVAAWGQQVMRTFLPNELPVPRLDQLSVDMRVVSFALLLSLLTGILSGLAPALSASRRERAGGVHEILKAAGRGLTEDARGRRVRQMLVVSEVALALILLVGAGLLIRSLILLQSTDPGFHPANVLTVHVPAPDWPSETTPEQVRQRDLFLTNLLRRVEALAGVQTVAMVNGLPTDAVLPPVDFIIEDAPAGRASTIGRVVSPHYFSTMGIPVHVGRDFTEQDTETTQRVVVVDQTFAERYFTNRNPIGHRIRWGGPEKSNPSATIVGVVGAVRDSHIGADPSPTIYASYLQVGSHSMEKESGDWLRSARTTLVMRTAGDPTALAAATRREIAALNPDQPITQLRTMEEVLFRAVASERFNMRLLTALAVIALVLAAAGIYGVVSYSVAQRTHEIGLRMALGAEPRQVLRQVVRQGLTTVVAGILIGTVGAVFLTRVMVGLLHGVSPTDSITFGLVALVLTGVAMVASYIPARRAMRVDPLTALRTE